MYKAQDLSHPKYRPDIDGLRAIAILSVVFYHAFRSEFGGGGFVGVDIFFVISGFLISTIIFSNLEKGRFSFLEFYSRRIRRIFPALLLVLAVFFIFGWFNLFFDEFRQFGKHVLGGATFRANFFLWKESGYFDQSVEAKPLLHLWSLAIEEQFYIVWPLLLAFVWKRKWNFLVITIIIATMSFVLSVYLTARDPAAAFYSPFSRVWELMIGGVLAYITLHKPHWGGRHKDAQSILGLILLVLAIVLINHESAFPGWWAILPTLGSALIIFSGPQAWFNKFVLSRGIFVWFGLISYPLYLWHWPIFSFLRIIKIETPPISTRLLAVSASIALAWLTYKLIEKPVRSSKKGLTVFILSVLMIGMGIVGWICRRSDGFPSRPISKHYIGRDRDFEERWQDRKCYLGEHDSVFPDICIGDTAQRKDRPRVMLWGDSFAASLEDGLRSKSDAVGYTVAQYTCGACPPIENFETSGRKDCPTINRFVLEQIRKYRPDTLILSANWLQYDGVASKKNILKDEQIAQTIQTIKDLGVKNIVLVGSLPAYNSSQLNIGRRIFSPSRVDRTYKDFNFRSFNADQRIRKIAGASNVQFLSPLESFCNREGCLISLSSTSFVPVAFDFAHLTEQGSLWLIENFMQKEEFLSVLRAH